MFMQRPEMFFDSHNENYVVPEKCEDDIIDSFGLLQKIVQECIDAKFFPTMDNRLLSGIIWAHIHGAVSLCISGVGVDEEAARAIHRNSHKILIQGLQHKKS